MIKVFYHSDYLDVELKPNIVFHVLPVRSKLFIRRDEKETPYELYYNKELVDSTRSEFDCNVECEIMIREDGYGRRTFFSVKPLVRPLSGGYARVYARFFRSYLNREFNEIESIQVGETNLYAIDQCSQFDDLPEVYDRMEMAFPRIKAIFEKPKSHLKAVNEVRPIETVKRVGYESIPYLAAHSEDWLARTVGGLKPARLFSRVEDDDYQIYENRVVVTLVELILSFLKREEKRLKYQGDQLSGIINSSVQTGSFGFDVGFQKAVSELLSSDSMNKEEDSKNIRELYDRTRKLRRRYSSLRNTLLFRKMKNSKRVSDPLNETNILTMDRNYSVAYRLWKEIFIKITSKPNNEIEDEDFEEVNSGYQQFCASLCGFAAHVLGFELMEDGCYQRIADGIEIKIQIESSEVIQVRLKDTERRNTSIPNGVYVPIEAGTEMNGFMYDGNTLSWSGEITDDDINEFCKLFKSKKSRGKEQSDNQKRYTELKKLLLEKQREYGSVACVSFYIISIPVELGAETRELFKSEIEKLIDRVSESDPEAEIVFALPLCEENEQKTIEYARSIGKRAAILPLSMYDINSYRRIQNILYRMILKLNKGGCLNCGGKTKEKENRKICDSCSGLTLTETICSNPDCKHRYSYLTYKVSEQTKQNMSKIDHDSFFQSDSMFLYKDIVAMRLDGEKIRTICPCCGK